VAQKKGILKANLKEDAVDAVEGETDEAMLSLGSFGKVIHDGTVFLEDDWDDLFLNGSYTQVPLLIGNNSEEANFFLIFFLTELSPGDFSDLIQAYDPDDPQITASDIVENPVGYELTAGVWNLLLGKGFLTNRVAKRASQHQDVYAYEFRWNEEPEPFDDLIGAGHAIEIPFVFGNFIPGGILRVLWSEANRPGREQLSEAMMAYWANFARTGDPNTGDADLPLWETWTNAPLSPKRMILDAGEIKMGR